MRILKEMIYLFTCTLLIIAIIMTCSLEVRATEGRSMLPTLSNGYVVVDKVSSHFKENAGLEFYDLVCLLDLKIEGKSGDTNILKRVIGLPGDLIEIKNGVVFRNGEAIDDYAIEHHDTVTNLTTKVSEGHIFVLGDNRTNSLDSRMIGEVSLENVLGRVIHIVDPDSLLNKIIVSWINH